MFRLFLIIICVALLGVCVYLLFDKVFIIKKVEINELSVYDSSEVLSYIDVPMNDSLFFTDFGNLYKKLSMKFPYISDVSVSFRLPDRLIINVTEDTGSMSVSIGGETYVLTEDFKVVAVENTGASLPDAPGNHRVKLITDKVMRCVVGEYLVFSQDNVRDAFASVYAGLKECGITDKIAYIDLTEKFYIKLDYEKRFIIHFGDWNNAAKKTKLFIKVVSELYEDDHGEIDVSGVREAVVNLYSKL